MADTDNRVNAAVYGDQEKHLEREAVVDYLREWQVILSSPAAELLEAIARGIQRGEHV